MSKSRQCCTYCGGEFKCGDCGERYQDCQCKVYQSMHQNCHKTRTSAVVERLKGNNEDNQKE